MAPRTAWVTSRSLERMLEAQASNIDDPLMDSSPEALAKRMALAAKGEIYRRATSGERELEDQAVLAEAIKKSAADMVSAFAGLGRLLRMAKYSRISGAVVEVLKAEKAGKIALGKYPKKVILRLLVTVWHLSLPARSTNSRNICSKIIRTAEEMLSGKWQPSLLSWVLEFLPWGPRLELGCRGDLLSDTDMFSWGEVEPEIICRQSLWARFGIPMHRITLEFEQRGIEKTFQVDMACRDVPRFFMGSVFTFFAVSTFLYIRKEMWDKDYRVCDAQRNWPFLKYAAFHPVSLLLLSTSVSLALCRWWRDRAWYLENFYITQVIMAFSSVFLVLLWHRVSWLIIPLDFIGGAEGRIAVDDSLTLTTSVLVVCLGYRLRFIHVLYLVPLSVTMLIGTSPIDQHIVFYTCKDGWPPAAVSRTAAAGVSSGPGDTLLLVGSLMALLSCIKYVFEVLHRKNFVMSLMLAVEGDGSDRLLLNILPWPVIHRLQSCSLRMGGFANLAEGYTEVSILVADVVKFTELSVHISAESLVILLNELFTVFDEIGEAVGMEKIKTLGDGYIAASGLPFPNSHYHSHSAARAALAMLQAIEELTLGSSCGEGRDNSRQSALFDHLGSPLRIRVGIHSGPCVAGVVGKWKFIYDVWGEAVWTAKALEAAGIPHRYIEDKKSKDEQHFFSVLVTEQTRNLLGPAFLFKAGPNVLVDSLLPPAVLDHDEVGLVGGRKVKTFFVLDESASSAQMNYLPPPHFDDGKSEANQSSPLKRERGSEGVDPTHRVLGDLEVTGVKGGRAI